MEIISKISKGTNMDQVYIPKKRIGFSIGSYVILKPLYEINDKVDEKILFYNVNYLEPVKLTIINEIFSEVENNVENYENIIITGSFLDRGFNFSDIDILIIKEEKINNSYKGTYQNNITKIKEILGKKIGINIHIILIDIKTLLKGLSTDPLYQTMLSSCVSKKRFVYNIRRATNYKILDLHLLKSKLLIDNFDYLSGKEKYELLRNAVSISLFIENKKISKDNINHEINKMFGKQMDKKIKDNLIADKINFLKKYKIYYNNLFSVIIKGIKNASKQKQAD